MGTMYYAINRESKKAVEVGKWGYYDMEKRVFASVEEVAAAIKQEFGEPHFDQKMTVEDEYIRGFAAKLWAIGNTYEFVSEHAPASEFEGYIIVESRFLSERDREYVGHKLSDHLSD